MILQDILRDKGASVHTISPCATLDDVVQKLVRYNVGSLVVRESGSKGVGACPIGIITERDILRAQAAHRTPLEQLTVAAVISSDLITASPDDRLEDAMRLMTEKRVRHLPVVADERLSGIVSIGDVLKAHHDELMRENHYMKVYIQGEWSENNDERVCCSSWP